MAPLNPSKKESEFINSLAPSSKISFSKEYSPGFNVTSAPLIIKESKLPGKRIVGSFIVKTSSIFKFIEISKGVFVAFSDKILKLVLYSPDSRSETFKFIDSSEELLL